MNLGPELWISILAGVALAAAAGFRAFLPLLLVSLASRMGWMDLNDQFAWLSSDVALAALLVATVVEVSADKIPVVDHLLDVVGTMLRPAAGILAGLAVFGDLPEPLTIAMALVFGTVSLSTQVGRAQARVGSTVTTGGLANPFISAFEDLVATILTALAIFLPLLAAAAVLFLAVFLWKRVSRRRRMQGGHADGRPSLHPPH